MCSNYRQTKPITDVYAEFAQIDLPVLFPSPHQAPNIEPCLETRPTDLGVVFRSHGEGVELVRLRWGLVPWFHRGAPKAWKFATFNARAETVKTMRSFSGSRAARSLSRSCFCRRLPAKLGLRTGMRKTDSQAAFAF